MFADCRLVATTDFFFAIKSETDLDYDLFLRPVNWLLKLACLPELILIGPTEVQEFMPVLRHSKTATLIPYSPRVSKEMKSFDKLDIYTIPERSTPPIVDADILTCLRIFAGQLYFNDEGEYVRFCVLLGLPFNTTLVSDQTAVKGMLRLSKKEGKKKPGFVPMIKKWIGMRRKGLEWSHTHVGRVLNGHRLEDVDFKEKFVI